MKLTLLNEIPLLDDKMPVQAVQGNVKYAGDLEKGRSDSGFDWAKQFFVLSDNGSEIGCTLWDAEGNTVQKDEALRIESTQNKKGGWVGITKGSYTDKAGKLTHKLEIRANQVKITKPRAVKETYIEPDAGERMPSSYQQDWPEVQTPVPEQQTEEEKNIQFTREHGMQAVNLYNKCIEMVDRGVHLPAIRQTPEQFQAALASIWIYMSSRRTTDGVHWWSYVDKMPTRPIKSSYQE